MQKIILSLVIFFNFGLYSNAKIVVLILSYNNKNYYQQNLLSLFKQDYANWTAYYVDDCSNDGTYELAYNFAKQHNMLHKMHFIKNKFNLGGTQNQYNVISQCDDRDIMLLLDGDDQLYGTSVLSYISDIYKDENVWMTYGSYVPAIKPFPICCADVLHEKNVNDKYFFRQHNWVFSHLRTFYAGLFKKIKKEDLMYQDKFLKTVVDLTVAFPMLEMANGKIKHYKYIDKVLYIYNNTNPLCEFRRPNLNIRGVEIYIRNKQPYDAIENLF